MSSRLQGLRARRRWVTLAALLWLVPVAAAAQPPSETDLAGLSLEELLRLTVVSSASKFPQEIKEAPASITVLRAEDIRRFGFRTLSDALRSVPGLYTTYDRNYSYLGLRGFARPGDYNTRFLLLLDGQRLNDGTYDMAPIGSDFPVDLSLVDRIEVIRGPGSSLYGTSAFFAVINVITKTPRHQGLQVDAAGGSLATRSGTATFTQLFSGGRALMVSGSAYGSAGQRELAYPEFAAEAPGGIVHDLDDDRARSLFAAYTAGRFSLHAGFRDRTKDVPTASYGTVFADGREVTDDDRGFVNANYERPVGRGWFASGRLAYDEYDYEGTHPTALDDGTVDPELDGASTKAVTGEVSLRRRLGRAHQFTGGIEVRRLVESRQTVVDLTGTAFLIDAPATNSGVYVQDEARLTPWLIANAGVRVDRFPSFGARATPRVGVVWLPRPQTAVKLLYARAFRAPNAYEMNYNPEQQGPLSPERIQSSEVVWEEFLTTRVRTSVSFFNYTADDIIQQRRVVMDDAENLYFVNSGHLHGTGVESEIEAKFAGGVAARLSHTYAHTRGMDGHDRLSNSPEQLAKISLQVPASTWIVALDGQFVGPRLTLDHQPLDPFFVANVVVTAPAGRRASVSLGFYNLFNQHYADPGAEEHLQRAIAQDGRSALAGVRLTF